jgi:hypothetical protein
MYVLIWKIKKFFGFRKRNKYPMDGRTRIWEINRCAAPDVNIFDVLLELPNGERVSYCGNDNGCFPCDWKINNRNNTHEILRVRRSLGKPIGRMLTQCEEAVYEPDYVYLTWLNDYIISMDGVDVRC